MGFEKRPRGPRKAELRFPRPLRPIAFGYRWHAIDILAGRARGPHIESMAIALLSGAGSGALHAITGPDHLLSLGPAALRSPHTARRIGLYWGIGHALGTLLLSLPLLFLMQAAHVAALAASSD